MTETERFFDTAMRMAARPPAAESDEQLLRRLADESEIRRVLAAYTFYYDGGDLSALDTVFAADAVLVNLLGEHRGLEAVTASIGALMSVLEERRHLIMNTVIQHSGPDRADVVSYLYSVSAMSSGMMYSTTGTYRDVFERRDGRWLIVERRVAAALAHRIEPLPADYDRFADVR